MTDVSVTLRPPCLCPSEGHKHGVSIQSSINLGDTLMGKTCDWKTADLILSEVVDISIIYRIPGSWLYSLNGYDVKFWSHDWWKPRISHFRVILYLCFKTSPRAKPFIGKYVPRTGSVSRKSTKFLLKGFARELQLKQGKSEMAYCQIPHGERGPGVLHLSSAFFALYISRRVRC